MGAPSESRPGTGRNGLSARGEELCRQPPFPEYLREHFLRSERPYNARSAPDGYIPLCIAENRQVSDLLLAKMAACRDTPPEALGYDAMIGSWSFREALAAFMSRTFLGRRCAPEQIAVLAGAGAVLEILFYAIAGPGEGVLVPTPSYAGFWMDLETRNQLRIVPVHGHSDDGFRLSPALLDRAAAATDRPVRALLLTSPSNPLGTVYGAEELEAVLDWAEERGLHVVSDEIYALSVYGERRFTSVASLRPRLGERLHVVWAFSKDFAASGLRCGVLLTENEGLRTAVDALAYWSCCSGDTQHLLTRMVRDEAWVDRYTASMQDRLRRAYRAIGAALTAESIPFLPAEAGFFVLCDLRRFLPAPSWEEEDRLWRRLLEEANVNLTPGSACRNREPGFLRLCFASVQPEVAEEGVRRIARVLSGRR